VEKTGIYIEKINSSKLVERKIEVKDAIEIYKENPAAFYPEDFYKRLWKSHDWQKAIGRMIAKMYNIKSVVDFGCGIGAFLEGFYEGGANIKGYEYLYDNAKNQIPQLILHHIGYGNAMEPIDCGKFDLAMSIEVAEHILEDKSDIFVENLVNASNKYILFTAAGPGQSGSGHINGQPIDFWITKFTSHGFNLNKKETEKIRDAFKTQPFKNRYMKLIQRTILMLTKGE